MSTDELILRVDARAIVLNDDGEILIMREAPTYKDGTSVGKYHFPGGRLDPGESYLEGLHREVMEEVGLEVEVGRPVAVVEWRPVVHGQQLHIISIVSLCKAKTTDVRLSEEHDESKWISPERYTEHDLLPAEKTALEAYLKDLNN